MLDPKWRSPSRVSLGSEVFNEDGIMLSLLPSVLSDVIIIPGDFITASSDPDEYEVRLNGKRQEVLNSVDEEREEVDPINENQRELGYPINDSQRPKSFPQPSFVSRKTANPYIEDLLLEDIPALFHAGSGKRGGVRLGQGLSQDVSRIMHFSKSQSPEVNDLDIPVLNHPFVLSHSEQSPELSEDTVDLSSSELSFNLHPLADSLSDHSISSLQHSQTKQFTKDTVSSTEKSTSFSQQGSTPSCHTRVNSNGRIHAIDSL